MRSRVRLLAASGVLLTMLGIGACERAATVVSPARAPAEPAVDPVTGLLLARLETAGGSAASRGFVPAAGALGAVAGVATSSAATFSSATLLTFEDLPSGQVNMGLVNPYHGVTFSSTSSSCALYDENDAGYMQAHSGEHYLFNAWGCDGEWLAFGGPVYFGGAWVSSPNVVTAAPELWFEGYRRGTLVGASARVTLQKGGAMQHLEANFPGVVDSVVIRRTTGSPAWPRGYYGVDDVCFGTAPVTAACEVAPNSAPTASVGGPYTGEEGAALALALGGSDPQGDALTYTWDFGDGAGSTGATPPASHVYADIG